MDINSAKALDTTSFNDPDGVYPEYVDESDMNRLARGDNLQETIVPKMSATRITGVPIADKQSIKTQTQAKLKTWDMPTVAYAAKYPHNKVISGESGHAIEIDDTPYAERLNWYHKSGTYNLIDSVGNLIDVCVGNVYLNARNNRNTFVRCDDKITIGGDWDIFVQNGANVRIHGETNINAGGNYNINILGDANVSVLGNSTTMVAGNAELSIKGNSNMVVEGDHNTTVSGNYSINAKSFSVESSGSNSIKAGGIHAVDASSYVYDNGASVSVAQQTISNPIDLSGSGLSPIIPTVPQQLHVTLIGRNYDGVKYFDEGSGSSAAKIATQIQNSRVDSGLLSSATVFTSTTLATSARSSSSAPPVINLATAASMSYYPTKLRISTHASIGTYNHNGIETISPQIGITSAQIATNLSYHAANIYDKIYALYPDVIVSSGYRNRNNNPIDNLPHSAHESGQAADFVFPSKNRYEVALIAQQLSGLLNYDELLLCSCGKIDPCATDEVWLHISTNNGNNRGIVWTFHNGDQYGYSGIEVLNYDSTTVC